MRTNFGWIKAPEKVARFKKENSYSGFKEYMASDATLKNVEEIKDRRLDKEFRAHTNTDVPVYDQGRNFDCVGHALSLAATVVIANNALLRTSNDRPANVACEPIYGGCRYIFEEEDVRCSSHGALVIWGVEWLMRRGAIPRSEYGTVDLSTYRPDLGTDWACRNLPSAVSTMNVSYTVFDNFEINGFDEANRAISQGFPVVFGSTLMFQSGLNDNGTGKVKTRGARHCFCALGVRSASDELALLCYDSRGESCYFGGPKNMPKGSVWVRAEDFDEIIKRGNEAYAILPNHEYLK